MRPQLFKGYWSLGSSHGLPKFTPKSIVIVVMGMTGAGKTTFINNVAQVKMEVGDDLKSCTKEIQFATVQIDGHTVYLIDTPGFDDTDLEDSEILNTIATYLCTDVRLSGILYLHPIDARKVGGSATKNLRMFQSLVGDDNMANVKLITTMWDCVSPQQGRKNLAQLKDNFWNTMLAAGAQTECCYNASSDGKRIIRSVLKSPPVSLRIQTEMIQEGLSLQETDAGKFVMDQLVEMRKSCDAELKRLRDVLHNAVLDRETVEAMRKEYEENLRRHEEADEKTRKNLEADVKTLRKEIDELKRGQGCIIL